MAIDFPNTPSTNDTFTVGNKTWIYDGTTWNTYSTTTFSAETLPGTTIKSTVTGSSLTSVGTLASLTVTGDVTVDTSTLKVDSTNNRVGIGTASPSYSLDVRGEMRSLFYGEKWTITGTAANTAVTITTTTSSNVYTNLDSTANWTLFIVASGYLIGDRLAIGDTFTVTHTSNQGATGYWMSGGISIDASSPISVSSIRWQGGTAPTTGNTNTTDVYVFTLLKTDVGTWEIFGSLTKFGA